MCEEWTHFEYAEGNPYIAKTEKEVQRILKKYGSKVKKIKDGYYFIDNSTMRNESARKRKPMRENHRNPLDEIPSSKMRVIELDNGDYYYLNYENGKLQAGHTTNTGFYPEYEIEYDWDFSLDHNIASLYDLIEDNFRFESVSRGRKKARRVESMRVGTRPRVRKPIKEATDDTIIFEQVPDEVADTSTLIDDLGYILENDKAVIGGNRQFTTIGYDKIVEIVDNASYGVSDKEICEEIEEELGVPYDCAQISGYIQSDWATVFYPKGTLTDEKLQEYEDMFFEKFNEFHNVTEDAWGYFVPHDVVWKGKDAVREFIANTYVYPKDRDRVRVRMIKGSRTVYDYDESYRKVRKPIRKESMGSHLAEYQKWVDYDMERYGRISDRTMDTIRKAGLSVVKDQYGEYEVIAYDRKESLSRTHRPVKEKVRKRMREGWRGHPDIEMIWHGEWADPDLEYKGYIFNYWDVEDAMWEDFLEVTGHKDSEANDPKVEKEFNQYVIENAAYYLDDIIAGGYFERNGKKYKSWHDMMHERMSRTPAKKSMRESMHRFNRHPVNRRK